ncbi:toll-like receptor 2 type-2 [Littorina saxatilis]|uniref:TIR domain-containing protein n=1 Tax=Littorina saxatilis TaxID=31220 RepID=A0AAN9BUM4_9CAEN
MSVLEISVIFLFSVLYVSVYSKSVKTARDDHLGMTSYNEQGLMSMVKNPTTDVFPCWSTPVSPYLITHPCFSTGGHVQCRCSNTTQDCSSNFGNLTYIPKLFTGVQVLNFSNNGLQRLTDERFFVNVSRDVWLVDLFNNDMAYIAPRVFRPLHKLRSVLIGGNRLSYETLRPVFAIPTLNKVDIKCGGLGVFPDQYFHNMTAVNVKYLDLSWNNMGELDMSVLQPLRRLTSFNLWHNNLYQLKTAYFPFLEYLSFHKNRLFDFPVTCRNGTKDTLFPNLTQLILDFNVISSIPDPVCLPKLRVLNMMYNRIAYFTSSMFSAVRFPALQMLEVTEMEGKINKIEAYAFNNSGMVYVGLGFNFIDFSSDVVDGDFLAGCTGLTDLYLNENNFGEVSVERFHRLLRPVGGLKTLYLGKAQIQRISSKTFINLPNLTHLYFYNNFLQFLPDGAFDQLPNLRLLSIGKNRISKVSSTTFSADTQERLTGLSLGGNPFDCSCEILWFQQWMQSKPHLFKDFRNVGYRCANLHNMTVSDFSINPQSCLMDHNAAVLVIAFVCLYLFLFSLLTVIFGYRWHLRLWLYAVCRGRHERSRRQLERQSRGFRFDVFLAYAEEDMKWVENELLPVLEDEWRLRVCVHQRDFVPGKHIVDNIADCVDESDRVVLVFSPHFARSQWCQFELKYCQSCVMDRDDVMVLVALEETESRDMSSAMLAILRTTTYIEWAGKEAARSSFWGRLSLALNDVVQS